MMRKVIAERYRLLRELGRGGTARVYLAEDQRLQKVWAVKVIPRMAEGYPEEYGDGVFRSEVHLLKKLNHPCIPRIVDVMEGNDSNCIVMDYMEGKSLERIRRETGPLSEEQVRTWGIKICEIFRYLHGRHPPVIYGDLKPSNLIRRPDGTFALIDFGAAWEWNVSRPPVMMGTRGFAAPEQLYGAGDWRSDIYSLGAVLDALMAEERSPGMKEILARCLAEDAAGRFQDIRELQVALAGKPPGTGRKPGKSPKRRGVGIEDPGRFGDGQGKHRGRIADRGGAGNDRGGLKAGMAKRLPILQRQMCLLWLVLAAVGFGCRQKAAQIRKETYEKLLRPVHHVASDEEPAERILRYSWAIAMEPSNPAAYQSLLAYWDEQENFGTEESRRFLALFDEYGDALSMTREASRRLMFQAAMMYLHAYTGETSLADRIQKAWIFLEKLPDESSEKWPGGSVAKKSVAEEFVTGKFVAGESALENGKTGSEQEGWVLQARWYFEICRFYRTYLLKSSLPKDPSASGYEHLLEVLRRGIRSESISDAYEKTAMCHFAFMILYDQREAMALSGIREENVLQILEDVYNTSCGLSVSRKAAVRMKEDILRNYEKAQKAVERAYRNR